MKQEQLDLVIRVQAGEPGSFDELYDEYYFLVYYFALKLCKHDADAKDITQETFIRVSKNIQNLREPGAFQTWLYRIVVSQSNHLFRKRRDVLYDDDMLNSYSQEDEKIETTPHKYITELSDREIVQELMLNLSKKRSDVLYLFYFEQLSLNEIAQMLDISIGTVKTRLFEGRKALKIKVKEFEKHEGRKITFRFGGTSSIFIFSIIGYMQKLISKQKYLQVVQIGSVVVCATSATTAIIKTNELLTQHEPVVQMETAPKEKLSKPAFSPITYHNQEITTNKEAYFALLDFASDENELSTKTKAELVEVKAVVDLFTQSEHAYRDQLETTGWLTTYQSLL